MILEACVSSYESAKYASHKKLDRVELCAGLEIGGLTPSLAMQKKVAKLKNINLHVLIRPRGGDFVYSSEELKIIKKDIHYASKHGAKELVFGCLNKNWPCRRKLGFSAIYQVTKFKGNLSQSF